MFNNLIESQSHRKEFKRRSSFFLVITAAYALFFFAAGIASIYAYDARLETQIDNLALLSWVPPLPATPASQPLPQPDGKSFTPTAKVDPNLKTSVRTEAITTTNDPKLVPENVGIRASAAPPVHGPVRIGTFNADPPATPSLDRNGCSTCPDNGTGPVVKVDTPAPEPTPVKPKTQIVSTMVLKSHAISLPQPPYPAMAKQVGIQGPVVIQILVDEMGRVVSAQVVSGNPILSVNAKEAALRARFTPTMLNNQPVKVQGVITYNFVLQ
jgi:periplasmic protein TonB